ncbi:MGMT family protein [Carboxylicivirga sp. M1479]|uniref:MGMT family protein n=1 Tax=Carboxylicivirga sp. M1479 TaxID=2594476 RepID=UPI0021031699|nr:MGMT family protein [Carboxylicivirga sp. M1479]
MPKKESDFFERVYLVAELIPHGRVTSYGAIAKYIGSARGARMVGWAMNKCSSWHRFVPAHRVVNSKRAFNWQASFPRWRNYERVASKRRC